MSFFCGSCNTPINIYPMSTMACGHVFHNDCANRHISSSICPCCEPPVDNPVIHTPDSTLITKFIFMSLFLCLCLVTVCLSAHTTGNDTIMYRPLNAIVIASNGGVYHCVNHSQCDLISILLDRDYSEIKLSVGWGRRQRNLHIYPSRKVFYYRHAISTNNSVPIENIL